MSREFHGASYDQWKTTEPDPPFELEPELELEPEPELPWCDYCGLQFSRPAAERNAAKLPSGDEVFRCDSCIERSREDALW